MKANVLHETKFSWEDQKIKFLNLTEFGEFSEAEFFRWKCLITKMHMFCLRQFSIVLIAADIHTNIIYQLRKQTWIDSMKARSHNIDLRIAGFTSDWLENIHLQVKAGKKSLL